MIVYIGRCQDCEGQPSHPFETQRERDDWANIHRVNPGHRKIQYLTETRYPRPNRGNYDQLRAARESDRHSPDARPDGGA